MANSQLVNSQLSNSHLPRCRIGGWGAYWVGSWALLGAVVLAISSSACAMARAETVPDGPPLQVPQPPERALAPVDEPVAIAEAEASEPEEPPPPAAAPRTPPPRAAPEPKPQPAPPAAAAAPAPPPRAPAETRELRPASPATAGVTDRSVRETLTRASRDLGRIDYTRLSADGRAQYEESKRFSAQAEEALKERNLIFAATLADKAATLAAELLAR